MLYFMILYCLQVLGVILSGLVFNWIQSANQLAGQFEKAMEVDDTPDEFVPKEALDGSEGIEGSDEMETATA
jgi:hypothetical protein